MPDHPIGNPDLIQQHKAIQRQGDREIRGGEPKGKETPGLGEEGLPEERVAGVVKPENGSPTLPTMKPAKSQDIETGGSGEGITGSGADTGP